MLIDQVGGGVRVRARSPRLAAEVAREARNEREDGREQDDPGDDDAAAATVGEVAEARQERLFHVCFLARLRYRGERGVGDAAWLGRSLVPVWSAHANYLV